MIPIKNILTKQWVKISFITIGVLVLGYSIGYIGYVVGARSQKNATAATVYTSAKGSLYTSEIATIEGKALSVTNDYLTIQNNRGKKGTVKVYKKIRIRKNGEQLFYLTHASFLKNVEFNIPATFTLRKIGTDFQLITVSYGQEQKATPTPKQLLKGSK